MTFKKIFVDTFIYIHILHCKILVFNHQEIYELLFLLNLFNFDYEKYICTCLNMQYIIVKGNVKWFKSIYYKCILTKVKINNVFTNLVEIKRKKNIDI